MSNLGGNSLSEETDRSNNLQGDTGATGADSTVPGPTGPASTVPGPPGNDGADGTGIVDAVVAGTNCSVDATDGANPIVNVDAAPIQTTTAGSGITNSGTASDPVFDADGVTQIEVSAFIQGVLGDSEKVATYLAGQAFTLPASLANSTAYAEVVPTANAAIDVQVNGVSKGSIDIALGNNVATFTFASPVVLAAGDRIQFIAQGTADATLADVSFTLRGTL